MHRGFSERGNALGAGSALEGWRRVMLYIAELLVTRAIECCATRYGWMLQVHAHLLFLTPRIGTMWHCCAIVACVVPQDRKNCLVSKKVSHMAVAFTQLSQKMVDDESFFGRRPRHFW